MKDEKVSVSLKVCFCYFNKKDRIVLFCFSFKCYTYETFHFIESCKSVRIIFVSKYFKIIWVTHTTNTSKYYTK